MQNVVNPKRDIAPRESLRGVREQFDNFEEDVVLLEGEIHSRRKSVSHHPPRTFNTRNLHIVGRLKILDHRPPRHIYQSRVAFRAPNRQRVCACRQACSPYVQAEQWSDVAERTYAPRGLYVLRCLRAWLYVDKIHG